MKPDIHPTYYDDAQVTCVCGATFKTGSTKKVINVEVCYKCHPLYTGEHRFIDTKGRVESFQKKQQFAKKMVERMSSKKHKKEEREEKKIKTLKELLNEV